MLWDRKQKQITTAIDGALKELATKYQVKLDAEKLVYTSSPRVADARARLGPVATIVGGGRRVRVRRLSEHR